MNLFEFFGKPVELDPGEKSGHERDKETHMDQEERNQLATDIFHYINHNDDLHKSIFLPMARKIDRNPTKKHEPSVWLPLVNKGCMEFYKEHKLMGDPVDLFDKEFRADLCKKIADFHHKHILMGEYNLGK